MLGEAIYRLIHRPRYWYRLIYKHVGNSVNTIEDKPHLSMTCASLNQSGKFRRQRKIGFENPAVFFYPFVLRSVKAVVRVANHTSTL
jgi:hypothetical protein